MAFIQLQFYSEVLQMPSAAFVLLPEAEAERLPGVLYLLHGYGDDHSTWMRQSALERHVAERNLAVVMPAVGLSFYCNEPCGCRYWDFVAEELPRLVHRFFRLSDRPEDTSVAGLSMGGYGAMRLALTFPERFAAAGCFSGAVDVAEADRYQAEDSPAIEWARAFGPPELLPGSDRDLFHLMAQNARAAAKPRLYVSCGTADFLYGAYLKFVPALRAHGWDVTAYEKPGAVHDWAFWDGEIEKFIPFALGE